MERPSPVPGRERGVPRRGGRKLLAALRPSQVTPRVVEVGWQLEELRIATFAHSLGHKGQLSAKRIAHELD